MALINLDSLFWEPGGYTKKRPQELVRSDIEKMTASEHWIVEGVFGELVVDILPKADVFLWLDLDWEVCEMSLISREEERRQKSERDDDESFQALMTYASNYWKREDLRSWKGHERLFHEFQGEKIVFKNRSAVDSYIEKTRSEQIVADNADSRGA